MTTSLKVVDFTRNIVSIEDEVDQALTTYIRWINDFEMLKFKINSRLIEVKNMLTIYNQAMILLKIQITMNFFKNFRKVFH